MTTYDSLIIEALNRMDIHFKEVEIPFLGKQKFIFFKVILAGKEFQVKIERVKEKKKKGKSKNRVHFKMTFFSGVYLDESLSQDSQKKFLRKIKEMYRDEFFYLNVYVDIDGEILFSTFFHTDGTRKGLENYYFEIIRLAFKEISDNWREIMVEYYS